MDVGYWEGTKENDSDIGIDVRARQSIDKLENIFGRWGKGETIVSYF